MLELTIKAFELRTFPQIAIARSMQDAKVLGALKRQLLSERDRRVHILRRDCAKGRC